MDSNGAAVRATVYEVHHQKLRDRLTNASCSSLDTLSPDASPRSSIGVPPSLLFRYPGSKAGTHPHMSWQHSKWKKWKPANSAIYICTCVEWDIKSQTRLRRRSS